MKHIPCVFSCLYHQNRPEKNHRHTTDWFACSRCRLTQELNLQCPSPAVAPPGPSFWNLPTDLTVPPASFVSKRNNGSCQHYLLISNLFCQLLHLIPAEAQGVNPSENPISPANHSHVTPSTRMQHNQLDRNTMALERHKNLARGVTQTGHDRALNEGSHQHL